MKNKNEVCVLINTKEDALNLYEIFDKAGERVYENGEELKLGTCDEKLPYYEFWQNPVDDTFIWINENSSVLKTKELVSVDQLAEILGVYEYKVGDLVYITETPEVGGKYSNGITNYNKSMFNGGIVEGAIFDVTLVEDKVVLLKTVSHGSWYVPKSCLRLAKEVPASPCANHDKETEYELEQETKCEPESCPTIDKVYDSEKAEETAVEYAKTDYVDYTSSNREVELRNIALSYAVATVSESGEQLTAKELTKAAKTILKFLKG